MNGVLDRDSRERAPSRHTQEHVGKRYNMLKEMTTNVLAQQQDLGEV